MSFGTTGRARMLNDMPLRFRFNTEAGEFYLGTHINYDRDEWLQRLVARFSKQATNPLEGRWKRDALNVVH